LNRYTSIRGAAGGYLKGRAWISEGKKRNVDGSSAVNGKNGIAMARKSMNEVGWDALTRFAIVDQRAGSCPLTGYSTATPSE
jgi:hypothetical protein